MSPVFLLSPTAKQKKISIDVELHPRDHGRCGRNLDSALAFGRSGLCKDRLFGLTVQDEEVDQRFYEVFGKVQKDSKITSGEEKDFWKKVVLTVFEPYSEKRDLDPLFEELWELFARGEHWRLAEGAKDTLSDLRNRGYHLAVLRTMI